MKIRVSNIQRFCLQDGPGIRTTVFLKGCSIHCPWCSNPENIEYRKQYYYSKKDCICDNHKCEIDQNCIIIKEQSQLMNHIVDENKKTCPLNAIGIYGYDYSAEELFQKIIRDRVYWDTTGGVTFSGGEALLQMKQLEPLLIRLKEQKIHLTIETSLFSNQENLQIALKYFDLFYVDAKILETESCKKILGGDITQYKKNVALLYNHKKELIFRIPCNLEYTLSDRNTELLSQFLSEYHEIPVEIFKIHSLGQSKYQSLSKNMWQNVPISDDQMNAFLNKLTDHNINARIIEI